MRGGGDDGSFVRRHLLDSHRAPHVDPRPQQLCAILSPGDGEIQALWATPNATREDYAQRIESIKDRIRHRAELGLLPNEMNAENPFEGVYADNLCCASCPGGGAMWAKLFNVEKVRDG